MKAYLHIRQIKPELLPLLIGSTVYFSLPPAIALKNMVPDAEQRKEVFSYLKRQELIYGEPDAWDFTARVTGQIRQVMEVRYPSLKSDALGLDIARRKVPPAVSTLLDQIKRASSQNTRSKLRSSSRAFQLLRAFCAQYDPFYVQEQIQPFFSAAEKLGKSVTYEDFQQWLKQHAKFKNRKIKIGNVYATTTASR